jgi:hypothetical protein
MHALYRSIRAASALLMVSTFSCEMASPQSFKLAGHVSNPLHYAHLPMASNPCAKDAVIAPAVLRVDATAVSDASSSCDAPPGMIPAVKPCNPTSHAGTRCDEPKDVVQAELDALGKAGRKISRAREKVLEILQTENACRAWFEEKDSNPAATLRTVSFALDLHGDEFVLESRDMGPVNIFRNPYVAKVMQGDGPYATVTLNTKGAFFSTMAKVLEVRKEGGPSSFRGTYLLHVGPYDGDTLPAQIITLLHEFGHVLDLLPADEHNVDGKSVQNTNEVVHNCGAEVDSRGRRSTLSASR